MKRVLKMMGVGMFAMVLAAGVLLIADVKEVAAATQHEHDWSGLEVPVRCTKAGSIQCALPGCDDITIFPPLGHDFDNPSAVENPTDCTTPGWIQCARCDAKLVIPANGHDSNGEWIQDVDPTCEGLGHAYTYCTRCDEVLTEKTIAATGHVLGDWVVDREAACEDPGEKHRSCEVCGAKLVVEAIPALNHTLVSEIRGEGANKEKVVKCSTCDKIIAVYPTL